MVATIHDPTKDVRYRPYQPFGNAVDIFYAKNDQVMVCGPSGTGKSRAVLEKMHLMCSKYSGMRALMIRKTRTSVTQSAMVTYDRFVLPQNETVHWRTGEQEYRYINGSIVVVGGMDKAIKVMSSEYDFIYVQEATELSQDDWETLLTRCRFGRVPYNQLIGDCNPQNPNHWVKKLCDKGEMHLIRSTHQDNPVLFDQLNKIWTPQGESYLGKLKKLSGVRYKRLFEGEWAAAEGMIYSNWDSEINLIDRFKAPTSWMRVWVVDFGYTNPFVWQCWAIDGDGRAYRTAEIYVTRTLVEDVADLIKAWRRENDEPYPQAIVCDHDAEDRATLERHLGMETTPALKDVQGGIHSVMARLRSADDGKPRMFLLRDSLLEKDLNLADEMKPTCTEEEIDGYEWEDQSKKETPRKVNDHGCDCTRYLSMHLDAYSDGWSMGMSG